MCNCLTSLKRNERLARWPIKSSFSLNCKLDPRHWRKDKKLLVFWFEGYKAFDEWCHLPAYANAASPLPRWWKMWVSQPPSTSGHHPAQIVISKSRETSVVAPDKKSYFALQNFVPWGNLRGHLTCLARTIEPLFTCLDSVGSLSEHWDYMVLSGQADNCDRDL